MLLRKLDLPDAQDIRDGDELRNINSYEYLARVSDNISEGIGREYSIFRKIRFRCGKKAKYDPSFAYGNLYTEFLLDLEKNITSLMRRRRFYERKMRSLKKSIKTKRAAYKTANNKKEKAKIRQQIKEYQRALAKFESEHHAISNMVHRIYANPNLALERSAEMIDEVLTTASHTSPEIESVVRRRLMGNSTTNLGKFLDRANYIMGFRDRNKVTPQAEGSEFGRLKAFVSKTYKPQTTTSLASIKKYKHQRPSDPKEYRFGTQGQYINGIARVNPIFEAWLEIQKKDMKNDRPITHVYFNLLALDRSDTEGKREVRLTQELHKLEEKHKNIAVITLPADKGIMDKKMLKSREPKMTNQAAFDRLFGIATGKSTEEIQDFYISDNIKKLLYWQIGDSGQLEDFEETIIENLLTKAFKDMGFDQQDEMSDAELQAVYFHFTKYILPKYIIEVLDPEGVNFSCKDAIDRGGANSLYYNLMLSLERGVPMDEDEFKRALHAAPTLVKGRGMNHHTQLLWNAIDRYINANENQPNNIPQWLVDWRDNNAPPYTKQFYIHRLEAYIADRRNDPSNHFTLFGKAKGMDRGVKLSSARKLLRQLKNGENVKYDDRELSALDDRRLAKIRSGLEKNKILPRKYLRLHKQQRDQENRRHLVV